MSIYVDDMRAPFGQMIMCHMVADSTHELLEMAGKIGLNPRWVQHQGTYREHFDVCLKFRAKAIKNGAVEITWRDYAHHIIKRRESASTT